MKKVLVGGCFDILHFGHVEFLKSAKKQGDFLVVMLESDEKVRRLKGKNRPIHTQKQRAEMLKSLKMVDEVIELPFLSGYEQYLKWVKKIKPDIIAVTANDPKIKYKQKQAGEIGIEVKEVIGRIAKFSTTKLVCLS